MLLFYIRHRQKLQKATTDNFSARK